MHGREGRGEKTPAPGRMLPLPNNAAGGGLAARSAFLATGLWPEGFRSSDADIPLLDQPVKQRSEGGAIGEHGMHRHRYDGMPCRGVETHKILLGRDEERVCLLRGCL